MSNHTSPSPSYGDVHIQITPPDEIPPNNRATSPQMSTSAPLTSIAIPIDEDREPMIVHTKSNSSIEKSEKEEKKKSRKSVDEPTKSKRKDTATSISNFIHRLTRFEKDDKEKDKHKTVIVEEVLDRPDKLALPEPRDDDRWLELKTMGTDNFRTALDMGNESGMPIYEWKADSLEETLFTEFSASHKDLIQMDTSDVDVDVMERSLSEMLDDFRSGNMRAFTSEQLSALRTVREEHEDVTNLHLKLNDLSFDSDFAQFDPKISSLCDELSRKMIDMHSRLAELVPAPKE